MERYTAGNLQQMVMYMSYNLNAAFNQYNEVSKLMYTGKYEGFIESSTKNQTYNVNELEQINNIPIDSFLKTLLYSDNYISSVYFVRERDGEAVLSGKKKTGGWKRSCCPIKHGLSKCAPILPKSRSSLRIPTIITRRRAAECLPSAAA
ncbi:hypothetical protein HMSSN036_83500 [Paenibacillus macerans]|nr:hypothetical protein HMSSN036_83500 [Paenibacillus macerans]